MLKLRVIHCLCNGVLSADMLTGMMPNPVWPPAGIPMPGAAVQHSVHVVKPAVTQSSLPATSKY